MKKSITSAITLSIMLLGFQAASATNDVKVTIKVPDPGWKVHIASMHEKEENLLVICHAEHAPEVHASVITDVTAKAPVKENTAELSRKIYLVGSTWKWEDGYTSIKAEEIEKVTKGSKLVYTAPAAKAPEPKDFIGLTLKKAEALAKKHNLKYRVVMVDGKYHRITKDYRPERLNFSVVKGKITKVTKG